MNGEWIGGAVSSTLTALTPYVSDAPGVGDFLFFAMVLKSLGKRVDAFREDVLGNMATISGGVALVLMTLWLLIQGYRIVTGQSRDSMAALVTNMARSALIVSVATSMAMFGTDLQKFLIEDVKRVVSVLVTGKDKQPEDQIQDALKWMQVAFLAVDSIEVQQDAALLGEKTKAQLLIGLGTGGPAVVAGSMLLLYKVALALFVGLGPLFILCLLFEQTKALFQKWLLYGLGTMFSMAVMAAMVSIALDMVVKVSSVFWTIGALVPGASLSSLAMQQGGMGLILTTMIITAPPIAAMFFQGTLGSFVAYSQIGGSPVANRPGAEGQPPGSYAGGGKSGQVDFGVQAANLPASASSIAAEGGTRVIPATGRRGAASSER